MICLLISPTFFSLDILQRTTTLLKTTHFVRICTWLTTTLTHQLIPQSHLLGWETFSDVLNVIIECTFNFIYSLYLYYLLHHSIFFCLVIFHQLEHTSEDYEEIPNITYHPDLCSINTITEAPDDPSDPPVDATQSLEYSSNSYCSEVEAASGSEIQEMDEWFLCQSTVLNPDSWLLSL